nr:hypothetical protein [Tanacetum cinerariifolium]
MVATYGEHGESGDGEQDDAMESGDISILNSWVGQGVVERMHLPIIESTWLDQGEVGLQHEQGLLLFRGDYPNYFSLKIHHGGCLSDSPNRKYTDDTFNFFDQVDVDLFSIVDLNDMLEILGYKNRSGIHYQYKIPDINLDFGLKELRNDQDALNLISHTTKHKLIEIYYDHENYDLEVVFEERTPMTSNIDLVKRRTPMKSSRLPLLLMGDKSEANQPMLDNLGNDETRKENYVEIENDEDSDIDKDISSDMEVSSDSEDSYWVVEEHIMNKVEVDMNDFYEHTDKDVEWIGCNKGNIEIPVKDFVAECVDLDDFDSASESDTETVNMLTNAFLIKDIEETIKPNPEVPIRALKDQLQKKYQLGYALLRDYMLELQRTNPETTVKLDVEMCFDPSKPIRQFRRIYICLGALKKGFRAGMKELLRLDEYFMKGQYPGQLLAAVGVNANHGTYPLGCAEVEAKTLNSWP